MKKQAIVAVFLILVVIAVIARINSGPSLETQLTEYLTNADQATTVMNTLRDDLDIEVNGMATKVMSGTFEADSMERQLKELQQKTKSVREQLSNLNPPPEAAQHKSAILGRCDTFSELVKETFPVIDIGKTTAKAIEQLTKDPVNSEGLEDEMKAAQDAAMDVQERTKELTKKGEEFETQAQAERERLIQEYDLELPASLPHID